MGNAAIKSSLAFPPKTLSQDVAASSTPSVAAQKGPGSSDVYQQQRTPSTAFGSSGAFTTTETIFPGIGSTLRTIPDINGVSLNEESEQIFILKSFPLADSRLFIINKSECYKNIKEILPSNHKLTSREAENNNSSDKEYSVSILNQFKSLLGIPEINFFNFLIKSYKFIDRESPEFIQSLFARLTALRLSIDSTIHSHNLPYCHFTTKSEIPSIARIWVDQTVSSRIRLFPPLLTAERQFIIFQMLVALCELHATGITHGSLSNSNFMLTSTGHLYLTDIGSFYKPFIIEGNSALTSYSVYYETSVSDSFNGDIREGFNSTYLAPERFSLEPQNNQKVKQNFTMQKRTSCKIQLEEEEKSNQNFIDNHKTLTGNNFNSGNPKSADETKDDKYDNNRHNNNNNNNKYEYNNDVNYIYNKNDYHNHNKYDDGDFNNKYDSSSDGFENFLNSRNSTTYESLSGIIKDSTVDGIQCIKSNLSRNSQVAVDKNDFCEVDENYDQRRKLCSNNKNNISNNNNINNSNNNNSDNISINNSNNNDTSSNNSISGIHNSVASSTACFSSAVDVDNLYSSDVFSLGCCIAELFNNGKCVFSLRDSIALNALMMKQFGNVLSDNKFREKRKDYDDLKSPLNELLNFPFGLRTKSSLQKGFVTTPAVTAAAGPAAENEGLFELIKLMCHPDPASRPTAIDCLKLALKVGLLKNCFIEFHLPLYRLMQHPLLQIPDFAVLYLHGVLNRIITRTEEEQHKSHHNRAPHFSFSPSKHFSDFNSTLSSSINKSSSRRRNKISRQSEKNKNENLETKKRRTKISYGKRKTDLSFSLNDFGKFERLNFTTPKFITPSYSGFQHLTPVSKLNPLTVFNVRLKRANIRSVIFNVL